MVTPGAGSPHLVRAGVAAFVIVGLSALAHDVVGGPLPSPWVLLALVVLTLAGTTTAGRFRFTTPRLVVLLGVGQTALHGAFTVLRPCDTAPVSSGRHAAHGGRLGVVESCVATPLDGGHHTAPAAMVVAHAVATITLAVLLTRGERAVEWTLAWLGVREVRRTALLTPAGRLRPAGHAPDAVPATRPSRAVSTRGPPRWGRRVAKP